MIEGLGVKIFQIIAGSIFILLFGIIIYWYIESKNEAEYYYKHAIKVKGIVYKIVPGKKKSTYYYYYYKNIKYYNFDLYINLNLGDSLCVYILEENPSKSKSESILENLR
ncbi:MAG: hypothetical protein IPL21_18975 [Saprospirales bacterium]|nr:hypothetical protein [Saprospirales bacterium]